MFIKVSWADGNKPCEQLCDVAMASKLMYELEVKRGIKSTFTVQY